MRNSIRDARIDWAALAALILAVTAASSATAQSSMAGMPGMEMTPTVSSTARQQVADVARAARSLESTSAAAAAGFTPVFGWIPTMGVHWVERSHMVKSMQLDRGAPDNLMFSKINGRDSLVGAAYAYFGLVADSTRPVLFDGAPPWHEHANLAPPGQTLTMLHV